MVKKILVPTDFSPCAETALRYAIDLAKPLGAQIELCHCSMAPDYQVPNLVSPGMSEAAKNMVELLAQAFEASRHELSALVKRYEGSNVALSFHAADGVADEGIVARAKEIGADLIVIGSHGRRGLSRVLLGSVTERVVRHAPCPVLVVHEPPK